MHYRREEQVEIRDDESCSRVKRRNGSSMSIFRWMEVLGRSDLVGVTSTHTLTDRASCLLATFLGELHERTGNELFLTLISKTASLSPYIYPSHPAKILDSVF